MVPHTRYWSFDDNAYPDASDAMQQFRELKIIRHGVYIGRDSVYLRNRNVVLCRAAGAASRHSRCLYIFTSGERRVFEEREATGGFRRERGV